MSARRYAEGTTVKVEQSRVEITRILTTHGVERMAWGTEPTGDSLQFELAGARYQFRIARPTLDEVKARYVADGGRWNLVYDPEGKVAAEWRRRWRAQVLMIKAKLEFIEAGDSTMAREFMPYLVLQDGRTFEQALVAGAFPMLEAGRR